MPPRSDDAASLVENGRQERLAALHAQLTEQVLSLTSSQAWTAWLGTAARFHQYSFTNTIAIWMQRPDATRIAGYHAWRALGRQVRKGERGIQILAPIIRKPDRTSGETGQGVDTAVAARAADPQTPVVDPDTQRRVAGYRVVFVFDIAQTDGPPLPEPVHPALLTGQAPPQLWEALAAQVEAGGFTLVDRAFPGGQNGETNFTTRTVAIHPDRDPAQRCKTLAHELAHTLMHHPEDPSLARLGCRDTIEVEAESVAYLVAHAHSLDSGSYTFPYLASWTTGHPDVVATLRATAGRVLSTAHHILDRLDQHAALHDTEPWDLPRAIGPRYGVDHEQQASPKPAAVRAVSVGR